MFGLPAQISSTEIPLRASNGSASQLRIEVPGQHLRAPLFALLCMVTIGYGSWLMFDILGANGLSPLEIGLLTLFIITFAWITIAFWSAVLGFFLQLFRLDPLSLKPSNKTARAQLDHYRFAVVMPVFNEDPDRVRAGFEANVRSLASTGYLPHFDFFLLSDTQSSDRVEREHLMWSDLQQNLGPLGAQCYYRQRGNNERKKVGNLADFCERWGANYEGMIVLDADSLMTGQCMVRLASTLVANPQAGLLQTVPIPVRQTSIWGRFLQFAAILHSPMLATGQSFWQTDKANYWGHNAIIRTAAFCDHCGLPKIAGKGPFSGEILSHDFVEAALLRRAGWHVYLLADLAGSYEEVPGNILDYATRDRRWLQGNIQHLGLLGCRGIFSINKIHFLFGAIAYLSSFIWLTMLVLSSVDAVLRATSETVFFYSEHQLFPEWPIAKSHLIFSLLFLTGFMLLVPKLMAILVSLIHRRRSFGGAPRLLVGAFCEIVLSVLVAPLMMIFHAYFVVSVFCGHKVNWDAQSRGREILSWSESLSRSLVISLLAILWGAITFYFASGFFWWLLPVLTGLVLAAPLIRYSSSIVGGAWLQQMGLFLSPSEVKPDPVLNAVHRQLNRQVRGNANTTSFALPAEHYRPMPIQQL